MGALRQDYAMIMTCGRFSFQRIRQNKQVDQSVWRTANTLGCNLGLPGVVAAPRLEQN